MLKRIFADNFRALVNFELRPGHLSLLLGGNGSGKTSVFDVLGKLHDLIVLGLPASELFSFTRTRWETRDVQRFEVDLQSNGETYRYALEVQHPEETPGKPFIRSETVTFDGGLLYRFSAGEVQLYRDDQSVGPVFPFRPDQSFLPNLDPPGAKQMARLAAFKKLMAGFWVGQSNPFAIEPASKQDQAFLRRDGRNFASFFSYLNSERPDARTELESRLSDALPGFRNLLFKRQGDAKFLFGTFTAEEKHSVEYALQELSEGQRVLVILYAAVCGLAHHDAVLCFDEPDNFVSLPEIQPWLQVLRDTLEMRGGQAMIISHHPEVMDYLALDSLWWFERPSGPVIARPYEPDAESPLKLSELVARGAA
ncbi:MAG TPA: AAA family ATPase [Thermoanaerobaculia bacterium]|jgi:predicted ATPase|nr:AAA family ATPase [Thermoanaerobaculia bacterium]